MNWVFSETPNFEVHILEKWDLLQNMNAGRKDVEAPVNKPPPSSSISKVSKKSGLQSFDFIFNFEINGPEKVRGAFFTIPRIDLFFCPDISLKIVDFEVFWTVKGNLGKQFDDAPKVDWLS